MRSSSATLMDRTGKRLSRTIGRTLGLLTLPLGLMVLPIAAQAQGMIIAPQLPEPSFQIAPQDREARFAPNPAPSEPLPAALEKKLITQVATALGHPTSDFRIGSAEHGRWTDECRDTVYFPGDVPLSQSICAPLALTGWKVVVTDGSSRWTYDTRSSYSYDGAGVLKEIRFDISLIAGQSSPLDPVAPPSGQAVDPPTSQAVPEPGLLLGLGLVGSIGLGLKGRRDRG
jgi:hypothetical protein